MQLHFTEVAFQKRIFGRFVGMAYEGNATLKIVPTVYPIVVKGFDGASKPKVMLGKCLPLAGEITNDDLMAASKVGKEFNANDLYKIAAARILKDVGVGVHLLYARSVGAPRHFNIGGQLRYCVPVLMVFHYAINESQISGKETEWKEIGIFRGNVYPSSGIEGEIIKVAAVKWEKEYWKPWRPWKPE